jgi:hypothetical protein
MFKQKQIIAKAIDTLVADVKNFVALNGGFIATANDELDTIYGYKIDWDTDDVSEIRILAVRVKDNSLQVAVAIYKNDVYDEPITEDYFTDDEWYDVGEYGDSILTAQTILSIADSIEQYV